jgi:hypothetical protein
MKKLITEYSFDADYARVSFNGYSGVSLENLLLITNVSQNKIIYNFADPAAGGSLYNQNTFQLDYATSGVMTSGDKLQIFYDVNNERIDLASGYLTGYVTGSGTSTGLYSPVVPIDIQTVGGRAVDMQSGFYPDYKRNDAVSLNMDKDLGGLLALQADLDYQIDSVSTFDAGYSSISNYSSGIVIGTNISGSGPTVVSGNYNRISLFGQNLGNIPLYVKYGAGASPLSFNFIMYPATNIGDGNGEKITNDKYKGDVSVNVQPSGATGYYIFWEGV